MIDIRDQIRGEGAFAVAQGNLNGNGVFIVRTGGLLFVPGAFCVPTAVYNGKSNLFCAELCPTPIKVCVCAQLFAIAVIALGAGGVLIPAVKFIASESGGSGLIETSAGVIQGKGNRGQRGQALRGHRAGGPMEIHINVRHPTAVKLQIAAECGVYGILIGNIFLALIVPGLLPVSIMIHVVVPETVPTVKFQLYILCADLLLARVCRADGRIARRMFVLGRVK